LPGRNLSSAIIWPMRAKAFTTAGLLPAPVMSSASRSPGMARRSIARVAEAIVACSFSPPMSGSALISETHLFCRSTKARRPDSAWAFSRDTARSMNFCACSWLRPESANKVEAALSESLSTVAPSGSLKSL